MKKIEPADPEQIDREHDLAMRLFNYIIETIRYSGEDPLGVGYSLWMILSRALGRNPEELLRNAGHSKSDHI